MYLACYEELASKLPGPPTSLILGDAYMYVQEVSCYRSCTSLGSQDDFEDYWYKSIIYERFNTYISCFV